MRTPGTRANDQSLFNSRLGVRSDRAWSVDKTLIIKLTLTMSHTPQPSEATEAATARSASLLLSRDELVELTGTRQVIV